MKFKGSRFLNYPATPENIGNYLLEVGVPQDLIDTIDLDAIADESISVKELLPSLIYEYPQIQQYIIEETPEDKYAYARYVEIRNILDLLVNKDYNDIDKEIILDEFGTLDPYMLIAKIWEERLLPDEKIFALIDEFGLDINRFGRLREEYYRHRATGISPELKKIVEDAKENKDLFFLDISKLPKEITKETVLKHLPTILVLGTDVELNKLEKLCEQDIGIFDWVYNEFPRFLDILKRVKKGNVEELFALPEMDYEAIKKMFPKTIASLEKLYKPVYIKTMNELAKRVELKPEEPKPVQTFPAPPLIPTYETEYFMGKPVRRKLAGFIPYYGETSPEETAKWEDEFHYNRLVRVYGKEAVDRAIEYVKRRFPYLVNAIPRTRFWSSVETVLGPAYRRE